MEPAIIGISQNIIQIREMIDREVGTKINLLVTGETGVGKELIVQSLYMKSNMVGKPFVKVNCAALPDTLLESESLDTKKAPLPEQSAECAENSNRRMTGFCF